MTADFGTLLFTGYQYGHAVLDLYGVKPTEDEGYIVLAALRAGTMLDLSYILGADVLAELGEWLDEQRAKEYRESCQEARAERALHYREMDALDCCRRSF